VRGADPGEALISDEEAIAWARELQRQLAEDA
jgi:hypothetical protein